jgi:hypothetical protein
MLKKVGSSYVDEEAGVTVRLMAGANPTVDDPACGVGYFRDERNSILFEFDEVDFSTKVDGRSDGISRIFIMYLFPNLIEDEYYKNVIKNKLELSEAQSRKIISSYIDEACELFIAAQSKFHPNTIYKIFYLNPEGYVEKYPALFPKLMSPSGPLADYRQVDVAELKKKFFEDVTVVLEQSNGR